MDIAIDYVHAVIAGVYFRQGFLLHRQIDAVAVHTGYLHIGNCGVSGALDPDPVPVSRVRLIVPYDVSTDHGSILCVYHAYRAVICRFVGLKIQIRLIIHQERHITPHQDSRLVPVAVVVHIIFSRRKIYDLWPVIIIISLFYSSVDRICRTGLSCRIHGILWIISKTYILIRLKIIYIDHLVLPLSIEVKCTGGSDPDSVVFRILRLFRDFDNRICKPGISEPAEELIAVKGWIRKTSDLRQRIVSLRIALAVGAAV